MRSIMYCIMCGKQGHGIRDCTESKFFIAQGICRMDVNDRVVMGDGTALPRAEGEGGAAKVIRDRMARIPSSSGPTATSAANEVIADEVYYGDEMDELDTLGSMEFKVLPMDRTEKSKKYKPYDHPDGKKGTEKTVPEVIPCPRNPQPNRAYMELPPTILKCMPSMQVPNPPGEDKEMVDAPVPVPSKGKSREHPVIVPTLLREPEVTSQKPREHISALKEVPRFEVVNPNSSNDKLKNHVPQYKYVTELMNNTNQEQVYQCILSH